MRNSTSPDSHLRSAARPGLLGLCLLLLVSRCGGESQPTKAREYVETTSAALLSSVWTATAPMSVARQNHVAALLPNGSVVVAGGHPGNNLPTNSAEVYSPASGAWTTVGSMGTARRLFGACTLASGKVLVAGGNAGLGDVASAELFDPSTNQWSATGSLAAPREDFSMTCLSDGRVLVAGGSGPTGLLSSAEVYNPASGTWSSAGTMPAAVHTQGAVQLNDGRVLIAGGNSASGPVSAAAIWSPSTNAWTATASMATARAFYALNLLNDGRVLAAGGLVNLLLATTSSTEIYNPSTGTWSAAAPLNNARYSGVSATLAAGPIVVGGINGVSPLVSSESYDSVHNTWTQVATAYGAVNQTATALTPTSVIVAGGNTGLGATTCAQMYGVLNGFALYAQRSVSLGSSDHINGGDIGVAAAAPSGFGPQLTVGALSTVQTSHNLVAPSVSLGSQAHVGDVQTNALTNSGATLGTLAAYPATMPALPLALPTGSGGSNVTVPAFTIAVLNPGNYGTLNVTGTVYLNAGAYTFSSVTMANQAHLAGVLGTATVAVAGTFQAGNFVSISSPSLAPAGQLVISVAGNDAGSTPAFSIGTGAAMSAILSAPHGTLSIGASTIATGAFAGFDVKLGSGVTIIFQDGFAASASSAGQTVPGHSVPAAVASAPMVGPVPGSTVVTLGLDLPFQNVSQMLTLMAQLYDPTNANYQKFLSPATFTSMFASSSQYQQLVGWAQSQGFQTTTFADNQYLVVKGPVSLIETVFHVNMNYYQRSGSGQFFAPDRVPTVSTLPTGLALLNIVGFNNFNLPLSSLTTLPPGRPTTNNAGSGPSSMFFGPDFRSMYVPATTLDGSGQSLAVVELDDFFDMDITRYETLISPAISAIVPERVGSVPGGPGPGNGEVALDIEMALAMAPKLQHLYVYEGDPNTPDTSFTTMMKALAAPSGGQAQSNQISISWGNLDGSNWITPLTRMNMQGQSVFFAAGDMGAFTSSNPVFAYEQSIGTSIVTGSNPLPPLSSADKLCMGGTCQFAANLMTIVGGTQSGSQTGTKTNCLIEAPWNDPSTVLQEHNGGPGGGGVCPGVTLPTYQPTTLLTTSNNGSTTARNIPDVSAMADGIWLIYNNGTQQGSGGTSAAAPLWAGFTALIHQQRANAVPPMGPIGLVNQYVYTIGQGTHYNSDFFDIASGTINPSSSDTSHWSAVAGYDLATGWGSPRLGLLNDLATPAPTLGPVSYDTVNWVITVGGDNLRCTSTATGDLFDSGGNVLHTTTFHTDGQSSWEPGEVHTVNDTFSPSVTDAQVASVRINFFQGSGTCQIFTTSDNWNIANIEVTLSASSGGTPPVTILNSNNAGAGWRLMDPGHGQPWRLDLATPQSLACSVACFSGNTCATQSDCTSGGVCEGSNGKPGSGCCTLTSTPCGCSSDCTSGNCFGSDNHCGDSSGTCQ